MRMPLSLKLSSRINTLPDYKEDFKQFINLYGR